MIFSAYTYKHEMQCYGTSACTITPIFM